MPNIQSRTVNTLLGVDETMNSLLGGQPRETVSGTIGRALLMPTPPAWAKTARYIIDAVLGQGHCAFNAQAELARRDAVLSLPLNER